MPDNFSPSILYVCQNEDQCVSAIAGCLKDPSVSSDNLAASFLSQKNGGESKKSPKLPINDPDVVVLTTDELSISVDSVREIQKRIDTKPVTRKTKIVIVPQAQKLTVQAQNAFLKTLEEPPENTIIILIAPSTYALLPTIVSRCQIITLSEPNNPLPEKELESANQTLKLIENADINQGFAWAKKCGSKRPDALEEIQKLTIAGQKQLLSGNINPLTIKKLFQTKKQLFSNTNVRLTLENLFLN